MVFFTRATIGLFKLFIQQDSGFYQLICFIRGGQSHLNPLSVLIG